jgi:hypothetical protein
MWRYHPEMSDDDRRHPFDVDLFLDGFTEEVHEHRADPDSPLGRAMAEAREAWAQPGYVPLDSDTWTVEPIPVELDE